MSKHQDQRPLTAFVLALLGISVLFAGCEELLFEPVPDTDARSIYEQAADFVANEYSFFDYKGIDWEAERNDPQRLDRLAALEGQPRGQAYEEELFDIIADLLFVLQDGHVNLDSDFDRSRNWSWYLNCPPNFDFTTLERSYYNGNQQFVGDAFTLMDFDSVADAKVGYIYYSSFGRTVTPEDMSYVIDRFSGSDYKGLIIDVRNNGGGSLTNMYTIANRFTDRAVSVAAERVKNGVGPDDFTRLVPVTLSPTEGLSIYEKPVVVLTNCRSYSATNFFAAIMRGLNLTGRADVTLVGDRTGGGGGLPATTELTNGWELRVSTSQLFALDPVNPSTMPSPIDALNVEGGVQPDVAVDAPRADLAAGTDAILDYALSFLRSL